MFQSIVFFISCNTAVWSSVLQQNIRCLESVQRMAARFPYDRSRSYHERFTYMNLSDRRKRGDVITIFQALNKIDSPIKHLFLRNTSERTRGHPLELSKDKFCTIFRQKFITNRVFDEWNSLPKDIVSIICVNTNF